ncbi:MAG: hypothetical protein Crog4KO_10440 [Crocinitomicaceae bacterium]
MACDRTVDSYRAVEVWAKGWKEFEIVELGLMENEYYKTKESVEEYIHLAKDVNGGVLIEKLKNYLASGSKLLELGSGPGTDWKILSDNYAVTGSDFSPEFIRHLEVHYPKGTFLELNAATLESKEKFDGIYSNKVLQHLKDEELSASIQKQYDMLNGGGVICHSMWKGEGSEIFKGMFVNYHTEDEIRTIFEPFFETLVLEPYAEFEADDSLLFIGRKK